MELRAPLFGTDGSRGLVGQWPMTPETLLALARAAAFHCCRSSSAPLVAIGKDTRLSGYMIEPALVSGFIAMGVGVLLLGPIPTPGVSLLTRSLRATLGVMISASHNPHHDNGIKLFDSQGTKLDRPTEDAIAALVSRLEQGENLPRVAPEDLGRARRLDDARGRYIEFVKSVLPRPMRFDGLKVVIDCAHGAASEVAPAVLFELGAEVIPLAVAPSGLNINHEVGAVAPQAMAEAVRVHGADIGLALDGDGDRLVVADDRGLLLSGDHILAILAEQLADDGDLLGPGVVGTELSNLALEEHLRARRIDFQRAAVGDRAVGQMMRASGYALGGEPSGHFILSDYAPTGDGLMAGLFILRFLRERGCKAHQILRSFTAYPQQHRELKVAPGAAAQIVSSPQVRQAIALWQERVGAAGRLIVRPSGTEPIVRFMAEGAATGLIDQVVDAVAQTAPAASLLNEDL